MHDLRQRLVPSSSAAMPARTARTGGGGRILSRGGAPLFHQSDGRLAIARRHRVRALVWCTRGSDYHSLVHQSTWKIVLYMSLAYFLLTVVFAVPYYLVSADCGLEMNSFLDAMYFSLETMMTIGYGVVRNDPYFEGVRDQLCRDLRAVARQHLFRRRVPRRRLRENFQSQPEGDHHCVFGQGRGQVCRRVSLFLLSSLRNAQASAD